MGEELETVASDVTSTILSQRMEIDSKNKYIDHTLISLLDYFALHSCTIVFNCGNKFHC